MDTDEVRALLQKKCKEFGSQAEFCRQTGASHSMVSMCLTGATKYAPTSILLALGLKRVIAYEPIKNAPNSPQPTIRTHRIK